MTLGFAAVPNWIVRDKDITAHEKLVYLILSSKIGDSGAWFTGHSEIAEEAGISVSSVQRALASLKERGIVTWKGRIDPTTGARLGNSYRIVVDRLGQADVPPRSEGPTPSVPVTEQKKNPEEEPIEVHVRSIVHEWTERENTWFDAVWDHWPKKTAKKAARQSFDKLAVRLHHDPGALRVICSKLAQLGAAHMANTPPQFQPMLSTIINGERWIDPLPTPRPASSGYQTVDQRNEEFYRKHGGATSAEG